jgi:hypothetical protein
VAEEVQVVDAELVESPGSPPATNRDASGRLLPGHPALGSRPKGAKNKVSHALLESFSNYITEHPDENPVITLINISMGRAFDKDGQAIEVPINVRKSAAASLVSTFCPPSSTVKINEVTFDHSQRAAFNQYVQDNPQLRGLYEKLAAAKSKAMGLGVGSRFIERHEGSQAAIEAPKSET